MALSNAQIALASSGLIEDWWVEDLTFNPITNTFGHSGQVCSATVTDSRFEKDYCILFISGSAISRLYNFTNTAYIDHYGQQFYIHNDSTVHGVSLVAAPANFPTKLIVFKFRAAALNQPIQHIIGDWVQARNAGALLTNQVTLTNALVNTTKAKAIDCVYGGSNPVTSATYGSILDPDPVNSTSIQWRYYMAANYNNALFYSGSVIDPK